MNTHTTIQRRKFDILNMSEEEGLILATLLNLSPDGVEDALRADDLYWADIMSLDNAMIIGIEICDTIAAMIYAEVD